MICFGKRQGHAGAFMINFPFAFKESVEKITLRYYNRKEETFCHTRYRGAARRSSHCMIPSIARVSSGFMVCGQKFSARNGTGGLHAEFQSGGEFMNTISAGNGIFNTYSHISSGKRINTAADDAAGLAIGQKMRQEDGFLTLVNRIIWQKPHNCGFFYVKFIKF